MASQSISTREFTRGKTRSVDSMRGIAVILMLAYHFLAWLLATSARGSFFQVMRILATFLAPPMFFIITGITLTFTVSRRQLQGETNRAIIIYVVKRYGALILIGFLLNTVVWGYKSIWLWDVLEVIGVCNIIAMFMLLTSSQTSLFLTGALGLASYYLLLNAHIPPLLSAIINNPFRGDFAIGPFLFFTVVGAAFGCHMINIIRSKKDLEVCRACLRNAVVLFVLGLILQIAGISMTRYPLSISYVLLVTGIVFLGLSALFWWQDVQGRRATVLRPVMIYGRYAFAIYIGHYLALRAFIFFGARNLLGPGSVLWISLFLFVLIFTIAVYRRPTLWKQLEM